MHNNQMQQLQKYDKGQTQYPQSQEQSNKLKFKIKQDPQKNQITLKLTIKQKNKQPNHQNPDNIQIIDNSVNILSTRHEQGKNQVILPQENPTFIYGNGREKEGTNIKSLYQQWQEYDSKYNCLENQKQEIQDNNYHNLYF